MKLQKIFATLLALVSLSFQSFAQINFQASKSSAAGGAPQYRIVEIGVVQTGDSASQGLGASAGGIGLGRSLRTGGSQAFSWTDGGIVGLPNLAGRTFCLSVGANDSSSIAGTCANSFTGTARLPVIWQNGAVQQLPLPAGQTSGDANDVNAAGVAIGSVGSGSAQRGAIYSNGTGNVITQTTSNGSFFVTAFRINNSGRIIGQGSDPTNAARTVGMVYDVGSGAAFEVGALPNANGALAYDVSNTGFVVGSSMMNQGSGRPYIWSQAGGMVEIPLPAGTTQGAARSVNAGGWAVGSGSGLFAVPFLYDGTTTYRLGDLIPANSGWDLLNNTTSSALGISDSGIIVGTGVLNGQTRAYAMIPVTDAPGNPVFDFDGDGKTDISIYRPGSGEWWINRSSTSATSAARFGLSTDRIAPADFTGDGKTDIAVWRPSSGEWFILRSEDNSFYSIPFGANGDAPVPADYDNDGKADIAVYRPANFTWYINKSSGGTQITTFGTTNDAPVVGDYDGDGSSDIAIFRPSTGEWWILKSTTSATVVAAFGTSTDTPVQGDYTGDGLTDIALFRPQSGEWFILRSEDNSFYSVPFGQTGDIPTPGDYDGDGRFDTAVFRSGTWYIDRSTSGSLITTFGLSTDTPVASAYLP